MHVYGTYRRYKTNTEKMRLQQLYVASLIIIMTVIEEFQVNCFYLITIFISSKSTDCCFFFFKY